MRNRRHRRDDRRRGAGRRQDDRRRAQRGVSPVLWLAVGLVGGVAAGVAAWDAQLRRHQRDLFSPSPVRRFAALGFLGGRPSVESARVLRDYVRWETRPLLRRRASVLLRRMEAHLD